MKYKKPFILLLLGIVCILIGIFLLFYLFIKEDFYVIDFKNTLEFNYKEEIKYDSGKVCYGTKMDCHNVNGNISKKIDDNKIGEHSITYIYKYKEHTLNKKQTIKIVDKEKPRIEVEDQEIKACSNVKEIEVNVKAFDNYDGDITDKIIQEIKDDEIIFSVEDSSGNLTTISVPIKIYDDEKPTITLNGNNPLYIKLNSNYEELGATASDNCDGDISENIEITGDIDTSKTGEYQITYSITDENGNQNSVIRRIYVYSNNSFTAPSGKSIYLTFDDGPSPYTEKLLDILKKYDVKATFFVTDQNITKGYDYVILRAYNEGHTIGLHTNSHNYSIYKDDETYFKDLYAIQNKVKRITGQTSTIIRFPGGSSNTISKKYDNGLKIMSKLTKEVEEKGFRYWDWNVSSGDAGGTTDSKKIIENVTKSLGNNSTYVVLQHDTKGYSVDAVEEIIIYGLSHGYTFRALTMESPTIHHGVNN